MDGTEGMGLNKWEIFINNPVAESLILDEVWVILKAINIIMDIKEV